jgi:hypothetical protein
MLYNFWLSCDMAELLSTQAAQHEWLITVGI